VNGTRVVERVRVMAGDRQIASHVGLHLLGEIAERSGLAFEYAAAVPFSGERAPVHDRGRLLAQVAVMLAGGGVCVSDMAALRDQPGLFGEVASDPTIWRVFQHIDERTLDGLRQARAEARRVVWAAMSDAPATTVLDVDGALIEVHSEDKEGAASHYKGGYGFHPMLCFADHSGEALAGMLRPGNAAANSAADQLVVVDAAIASLPPERQAGHALGDDATLVVHPMVVRADSAGAVKAFVDGLVERNIEFSVSGRVSDGFCAAIAAVPEGAWRKAMGADGEERHAGEVAELDVDLPGWPPGTRAICRREEPHQGAQLRLWDVNGYRHQVTLTNSASDPLQLELRQRLHARVENSVKALRDTGLDRMPFTSFTANQVWFEIVLTGSDLLAWLRAVCLDGDLARAEPKTLRYRLLHTAGRIIRKARRIILRLPEHWRWAQDLVHAYQRLDLLSP
jgi:Transposase DDE domain group 1